jgi:multidrug efflux pump subunit AcrB
MSDMRTGDVRRQQRTRRRGMLFAGETEARPGIMTSEFLLTLLAAAVVVIAGYVSDTFSEDLAWALFAGIIAAYVLSRGIAKAGSKEGPFVVRGGGEQ